ncbi:CBS domain-containing protein [bacterium]|nr:CBS domain-containing protein [bacterium]MBU1072491.1 CBS domain-containing protein [bacterium]MBU1675610.1 CBS domain-containing protein [bacterium]
MDGKRVGDLMLPLDEYAVVSESASLRDALDALERAQTRLAPGRSHPRAVLVRGRDGNIVGKLGMHGFLKALEPKYAVLGDVERLSQAGLNEVFVNSVMENYRFWQDNIDDVCRRAHTVKVGQVMRPVESSIDENRSLTEAIHLFVMWQTQSLPVTRDGRVVGVLRLSDLFREISQFVTSRECG